VPYLSADTRREAFVDAAIDVIAKEGLTRATTRRIAERADAPLGALHYCFRNKNELMELIYERGAASIRDALEKVDPSKGVETTIRDSVGVYWRFIRDNLGLQLALFELGLWMIRNRREEMYANWNSFGVDQLRQKLDEAARADGVELATPAAELARFLFHSTDVLVLEYAVSGKKAVGQRQANLLADALVAMAGSPPRADGRRPRSGSTS
jgi:AcrR family transcriptional regulator